MPSGYPSGGGLNIAQEAAISMIHRVALSVQLSGIARRPVRVAR